MNISERANWLANDFREAYNLELSDLGVLSMAAVLRVHFFQVAKAAEQRVSRWFAASFLIGIIIGSLVARFGSR